MCFTRNLLLIVLLSVLRIFWVERSMLLWKIASTMFHKSVNFFKCSSLKTAESSTAGNISHRACDATATGTRIDSEDTNSIKMETTTPYNDKCTNILWWTVQVGQTKSRLNWLCSSDDWQNSLRRYHGIQGWFAYMWWRSPEFRKCVILWIRK